jgi:WD40 repeat protein
VEKLNQCRTSDDVEIAFQELPVGMGQLYDRMATNIARHERERDRLLAKSILQCVVCSLRVLTVAELTQACAEDMSKLLNLHRHVVDICCGFVVIDNGGNVAMVHQTAREYLLNIDVCPYPIEFGRSHEQMFLSCMKCLMTVGARAKVSKGQSPVFMGYAATWWSLHLVSIPVESTTALDTLNQFLTGQWVLCWIEYLARHKQLRVLVQTAKNFLKVWDKRQEHHLTFESRMDESTALKNVKSWAIDLVKIVAKFGSILTRGPESIYKLIPPFCPQGSFIYQQFGRTESKTLEISGLSATEWDDSLARLSTGLSTYTSAIACAGTQISILTSSGNVSIYDSVTFEEKSASPIRHGESVYCMVLNSTGTLLATYGYQTTRVWDVATGQARITVPNVESRPRPLAMLILNNNSTLLVGTDDRRIRSLDLTTSNPSWIMTAELDEPELKGLFLNSANYMALSENGTLVAVAYRGHPTAAWEVGGPLHISHCWLKGREKECAGEVIDACWHPHYPELLGLYLEGVVFKWRPYEDSVDELPVTGVSRLQISKDGNLFATGDVRGTVKIYATSDFRNIYCLASEDPVLGLAFSPSSRRFFDIRGYYGNAWQPDALMRFAEQTDKGINNESETESLTPLAAPSESSYYWIDTVTVVTSSPAGRLYCHGTEKGTVQVHDVQEGRCEVIKTSKSHLSIEKMAWSENGYYMAFSDSSNTVFIFSMTSHISATDSSEKMIAQVPMRDLAEGHILQLLFASDSRSVLVISLSTICNLSLSSLTVTESLKIDAEGFKYIIHPQDPSLYLGIGPNTINVLDRALRVVKVYTFERSSPSTFHGTVDRVVTTTDKMFILIQMAAGSQTTREKHLACFSLASVVASTNIEFNASQEYESTKVALVPLPEDLPTHVAQILSFLPNYRLVFLSRNFSVCQWQMPLRSRSIARSSAGSSVGANFGMQREMSMHSSSSSRPTDLANAVTLFTLPGDWISRECLALCGVWSIENSFLCPRSGEVAVVKSAALV